MDTTPAELAAALAAAIFGAVGGTVEQAEAEATLTAKFENYEDVGALKAAVERVIARLDNVSDAFEAFNPEGAVELVSELPTDEAAGAFWMVTTGDFAGHGFLRIGVSWVDCGPVRGAIGPTPDLSFTLTMVSPSTPASVSVTGTPEDPVVHLNLPRGRNAKTVIEFGFAYAAEAGEVLRLTVLDRDTTFDVAACVAKAEQAAGVGGAVITILKNGVAWGTITFAAGSLTGVFAIPAPTASAGDVLKFVGPVTATTLAHVAAILAGAE